MARLSDVSPGDIITSTRQNDINDYINDGTEYVNTSYLNVGGTTTITSGRGAAFIDTVDIEQTTTTGNSLYIHRNLAAASTNSPLVAITSSHASDDQPALSITQNGAGNGIFVDQNGNYVSLDIDSEATGYPLINLAPLNSDTRGDICFSTARTGNPSSPSEADLWYNSTDKKLRYYNGSGIVDIGGSSVDYNQAVQLMRVSALTPLLTTYNVNYDAFANITYVDTTNSTCYFESAISTGSGQIYFATSYDRCTPDGTPSATKWTVYAARPAECTPVYSSRMVYGFAGNQNHDQTVSVTSNGSSGINFFSANIELVFRYSMTAWSNQSAATLCLTNNAQSLNIVLRQATNGTITGVMRVIINASAKTAEVWYDDTAGAANLTGLDLSTLGTSCYLKAEASNVNAIWASFSLYGGFGYSTGGSGDIDLVSSTFTSSDSKTVASGISDMLWGNAGNDTDNFTQFALSANGGTNYATTTSLRSNIAASPTGTSLKYRFRAKQPATINTTTRKIASITGWRVMWFV